MPKRTLIAALLTALCVTGCGSQKQPDPDSSLFLPDNGAEATAAAEEPTLSVAERAKSMQEAGETHLFDEQGVLTEEETAQYNTYLGWLSDIRQIRSAAVITDQLGSESPEQFAKDYYRALFGEGTSGFLVLVNNDTGRDYVYCEGVCEIYLADTSMPIAKATPLLVEGRYAEALEILLPVGELVPDRVLDRADALTAEQAQTLMERANAGDRRCCVIFTDACPVSEPDEGAEADAPPEDLRTLAEDLKVKNEAEVLLVIDTVNRRAWVAGGEDETLSAEVGAVLRESGAFDAAQHYYDAVLARSPR